MRFPDSGPPLARNNRSGRDRIPQSGPPVLPPGENRPGLSRDPSAFQDHTDTSGQARREHRYSRCEPPSGREKMLFSGLLHTPLRVCTSTQERTSHSGCPAPPIWNTIGTLRKDPGVCRSLCNNRRPDCTGQRRCPAGPTSATSGMPLFCPAGPLCRTDRPSRSSSALPDSRFLRISERTGRLFPDLFSPLSHRGRALRCRRRPPHIPAFRPGGNSASPLQRRDRRRIRKDRRIPVCKRLPDRSVPPPARSSSGTPGDFPERRFHKTSSWPEQAVREQVPVPPPHGTSGPQSTDSASHPPRLHNIVRDCTAPTGTPVLPLSGTISRTLSSPFQCPLRCGASPPARSVRTHRPPPPISDTISPQEQDLFPPHPPCASRPQHSSVPTPPLFPPPQETDGMPVSHSASSPRPADTDPRAGSEPSRFPAVRISYTTRTPGRDLFPFRSLSPGRFPPHTVPAHSPVPPPSKKERTPDSH